MVQSLLVPVWEGSTDPEYSVAINDRYIWILSDHEFIVYRFLFTNDKERLAAEQAAQSMVDYHNLMSGKQRINNRKREVHTS